MEQLYYITRIHRNFSRNKGTPLENLVYAELREERSDDLIIAATLDYILEKIKERKLSLVNDIGENK